MEQTSGPSSSSQTKTFFSGLHHHQHRPIAAANSMLSCKNSPFGFNLNQENDEELGEQLVDERENENISNEEQVKQFRKNHEIPKEPMFEKPLTPSDVGKLNRLVIPKQHAEKYFPIGGGFGDSGEKGLLLSFEDELGKSWRFRYSYWTSSQSYVLTKGWSRFVKDKQLDAGDVVLFERHRLDGNRLFIGWRRRTTSTTAAAFEDNTNGVAQQVPEIMASNGGEGLGTGGWTPMFYSAHPYPYVDGPSLHYPYRPDHHLHTGAGSVVQDQRTTSGNSKRLRLFGVNLECHPADGEESEPPTTPNGSTMSSQSQSQAHYYPYNPNSRAHASTSNLHNHNHMVINFSGDINQTRYR